MDIIELKNVSKFYLTQKLYDNVNFTISSKDKIALLGNNGVGKSTLLKIILEEEITDDVTIYAKLDKNEEVTDNPSEDETEDDALLDDVPKTGEKFSFIKWLISLFR